MTKTLRLLSLATVLATGVATATMAANDGASGSQQVTGTMTGSQQVGTPATGNTVTTRNGQVHDRHTSYERRSPQRQQRNRHERPIDRTTVPGRRRADRFARAGRDQPEPLLANRRDK